MAKNFKTPTNTPAPIPGQSSDDTPEFPTQETTGVAGGYNANYKPPTADKFKDPSNPYLYSNEDWQLLLSMGKDRFATVQNQLAQIYPEQFRNPNPGKRNDPSTIYYFKQALSAINGDPNLRGKMITEALPELAKNPIVKYQAPTQGTKLPAYQVTNPADLKAVFKKTAESMLGRTLGDGDLNKMVSAFQQQEAQYQKAAYAGGGKIVQQAPNAQTFATTSLEKDFGTEVDTQKMDNIFSSLNDALMKGK